MQWSEKPSKQTALTCPKKLPKYNIRDTYFTIFLISMPLFLFIDPPEIEIEQNWYEREGLVEVELICVVHAKPPAEVSRVAKNCISINLY